MPTFEGCILFLNQPRIYIYIYIYGRGVGTTIHWCIVIFCWWYKSRNCKIYHDTSPIRLNKKNTQISFIRKERTEIKTPTFHENHCFYRLSFKEQLTLCQFLSSYILSTPTLERAKRQALIWNGVYQIWIRSFPFPTSVVIQMSKSPVFPTITQNWRKNIWVGRNSVNIEECLKLSRGF